MLSLWIGDHQEWQELLCRGKQCWIRLLVHQDQYCLVRLAQLSKVSGREVFHIPYYRIFSCRCRLNLGSSTGWPEAPPLSHSSFHCWATSAELLLGIPVEGLPWVRCHMTTCSSIKDYWYLLNKRSTARDCVISKQIFSVAIPETLFESLIMTQNKRGLCSKASRLLGAEAFVD